MRKRLARVEETRVYKWGSFALSVVSILTFISVQALVAWSSVHIGVGWDEEIEARWLRRAFAGSRSLFRENALEPTQSEYVSGLAYQWFAHLVNVFRGNEIFGYPDFTAESYAIRHLSTFALFLLGALVVGAVSFLVTKSQVAGLFSAAAYSAMPVFAGHAAFNHKDVPAAVGFTLFSAGLVILLKRVYLSGRYSTRLAMFSAACLTVGWYFAVGVRFAFWVVLVISLMLVWLLSFFLVAKQTVGLQPRQTTFSLAAIYVIPLASIIFGTLALYVAHPHLRNDFARLPLNSLRSSGDFGQEAWTLAAGQLIFSQETPWWYLPSWMLMSTPLLLGIVCLVGLLVSMRIRYLFVLTFPFLFQLIALPLVVIALSSPMYDGQRHSLYIFPALAFFSGITVARFFRFRSTSRPSIGLHSLGVLILALALVFPLGDMIRLRPYMYIYTNPARTVLPEELSGWETDYWGLSVRETITKVPMAGELAVWGVSGSFTPFLHLRGSSSANFSPDAQSYWWIKHERNGDAVPIPDDCQQQFVVDRSTWYWTFTLARIYKCSGDIRP